MAYYNDTTAKQFPLVARVQDAFAALTLRYKQRRVYLTTLNSLEALTNRDLADLGLNRSELHYVAREASKS